ncbi:MAG: hypothetical protein KGJ12_00955 [Gammaproteobacteria bacterium]|nr:hypothetical protein [Gammaproteobacteria bacterium]
MTGIGFLTEGVCITRVVREKGQRPQLELCEFTPCAESERLKTLAEGVQRYQLEGTPCVAVMEPGSYSLLQVEAPDVDPTELKAAVRWRIKDLIDFHIDDAVIDVFDIPGQTQRGRVRMMYVVAARTSLIQHRVDLLNAAGVELSAIDITELVLRNVTALLPEDVAGVALLHLRPDGGLITLTRQSTLYLARALDVAADLSGPQTEAPGAAVTPRLLDTIALEIQRSFDYYESYFSQPPLSGLVISAQPPAAASDLIPQVGSHLGGSVRALNLNAALECREPLSEHLQALCLPAIGAALRVEEKAL